MGLADDGCIAVYGVYRWACERDRPKQREGPLRDYCLRLMKPCDGKSLEPVLAAWGLRSITPSLSLQEIPLTVHALKVFHRMPL